MAIRFGGNFEVTRSPEEVYDFLTDPNKFAPLLPDFQSMDIQDERLLRGRGKFVDDIKLFGMLYLKFVRSPYAHANVTSLDTSAAEALPGVVCTLTGAEIAKQTNPFIEIGPDPFARIKDYPLAVSKVRYRAKPFPALSSF